jgi:hypothetical protein
MLKEESPKNAGLNSNPGSSLRQALDALTTQPKRKIEKEEKGALLVAVTGGKGEWSWSQIRRQQKSIDLFQYIPSTDGNHHGGEW